MSSSHWIAVILFLLFVGNTTYVYLSKKRRTQAVSRQAKENLRRSTEQHTAPQPRLAAKPSPWYPDSPVGITEQEASFAQAAATSGSNSDE